MSILACVFYVPERNARENPMELNFEGLEMQKWNTLTDRADEKDGVILLIIKFTPKDMVIKMS